jgi:hypothetical protein
VAEITLTVSGVVGSAPTWGVTFDHAALVTAGRSRADGADFYVRHTTTGPLVLKGITGANTATCSVDFLATTATVGDTGYRLGFGDLGWQTSRVVGGAYAYLGTLATASVPALTLPEPGFVMGEQTTYSVAEIAYPDSVTTRRRALSEHGLTRRDLAWANVSPEDWYEIRAFVAAQKGGASSFTAPAWLGSGTWRVLPGSFSAEQFSRRGYRAALSVESCVA